MQKVFRKGILESILNAGTAIAAAGAIALSGANSVAPTNPHESTVNIIQSPKYAVLLIDASYTYPELYLDSEVNNMAVVLQEANTQNIPVYEINFTRGDPTDSQLMQYKSANWHQIRKNYFDSFQETNLAESLKQENITDLILMGFNQMVCVKKTALSAYLLGYKVHTSFDVIQGSRSSSCELIFEGKSVDTHFPCYITKTGGKVIPTEIGIESDREWYAGYTELARTHKALPIFKK